MRNNITKQLKNNANLAYSKNIAYPDNVIYQTFFRQKCKIL